jgi:hypothetical protein
MPNVNCFTLGLNSVSAAIDLEADLKCGARRAVMQLPSAAWRSEPGRNSTNTPTRTRTALASKALEGLSYPHSTPLTRREIEAVADYIILALIGK